MGILPNHDGLSAAVFVDDQLAEQHPYDEPESSNQTIIKYIEAISEATFSIEIIVPTSLFAQYSVLVRFRIDGEEVLTKVLRRNKHSQFGCVSDIHRTRSYVNNEKVWRNFCFAKLKTCESLPSRYDSH